MSNYKIFCLEYCTLHDEKIILTIDGYIIFFNVLFRNIPSKLLLLLNNNRILQKSFENNSNFSERTRIIIYYSWRTVCYPTVIKYLSFKLIHNGFRIYSLNRLNRNERDNCNCMENVTTYY